jgi:ATP-binding cassette subfamily B (MDR/TAP) protein 1
LDEATSALDRRNEKLIQSTIQKVSEDKITITIAHRVKTIMDCDEVFVFDNGGLVEKGKF